MPASDEPALTQGEAEIAAAVPEPEPEEAAEPTPEEIAERAKSADPVASGKVWRWGYLFTMVIFGAFSIWRLDYDVEDDRYDLVDGFFFGVPLWAAGLFGLYIAWWLIRYLAIDIRDGVAVEARYTSPYGDGKYLYKYPGADGKTHSYHLVHKKDAKPPAMLGLRVIRSTAVPASAQVTRYVLTTVAILITGGLGGLACYYAATLMPAPAVATLM
ncbi:hypothetical protein Afil01_67980 [Actinorhabdospora filicis]|uniref:Uncharacterized protein n=1 Tax=Actinorhabdospora filicis TaxID=1785913 RepID=A0A9W6ST26_9ACTN|nr:hypothetical protein [Actinorhabdospora filicis]GLZ81991.1 hypothetical protein Afil01_67980 [Actinorhabdospora filicis]